MSTNGQLAIYESTNTLVTLSVTADSPPSVAGPTIVLQPSISALTATYPTSYAIAVLRPSTGCMAWEVNWTLNHEHFCWIAEIPAAGGLTILRPKTEGPQLSAAG